MVTIVCSRCGGEAAVKRTPAKFCPGCRAEVRREVNARSDKKNAGRVRAATKKWRTENRERVRELERRRAARPDRKAYHRELYWRKRAVTAAPLWAAAAKAMEVPSPLLLPAGPGPEVRRPGPCCPVTCATPRRFAAGFCLECGEPFVVCPDRGDRFCSLLCGKRYDRRQRRARKVAAFVEPVFSRRVFERDGWRCQLCKRLVSKRAVVPHPRAATIDHIVPLSKDGEHSMANVHTAHFMCNSQKGAQAMNEQLLLVG